MNNFLYHLLPIWNFKKKKRPISWRTSLMFPIICVSALPSESTNLKDQCCFSWHNFFSHRIHPKCTQNRLLIQQLRLQSLGLLFSHRKSLSEDWMKIGMLKKNLPSNWDTKAENNSLVWSMDVCSYKSLKEATDLEERLHKEESHSEDPPHFQHLMAHHGTGLQGPWRRKLRYWYLEASFLLLHGDS